ncbi:GNAT family protein [Pedobacter agri]|uniref:GNAT family N-acetyltransferase n=1 Tax=Pedobacter agri TaxID=454586 RepID=UPI00293032C1|nr:GNAT family protein [Pedobacter agri]
MKTEIYLRPLTVEDATISSKWRNDPKIWVFTKFVSSGYITSEMERQWILDRINRENEKRFAICLKINNQYIGNIQLLNITTESAEFHLFIGERQFWGKGVGYCASILLLKYAFYNLDLNCIFLEVHADNLAAFSIYKKVGFKPITQSGNFIRMGIDAKSLKGITLTT